MNVLSHHKWWSTFKSAVFGTSSSLPPLVSDVGGLVCESVGIVVVVVVGQTVGSISSKTLDYDCLYTLELCTASLIATS